MARELIGDDWTVDRVQKLLDEEGVVAAGLRLEGGVITFTARTIARRVVGRGADPVEATNEALKQLRGGAS